MSEHGRIHAGIVHYLQGKFNKALSKEMVKDKKPEDIRELLGLPNDLDRTDIAAIKRSNRRCRMNVLRR